jgi:hypothetical protein
LEPLEAELATPGDESALTIHLTGMGRLTESLKFVETILPTVGDDRGRGVHHRGGSVVGPFELPSVAHTLI